MFGNLVAAGIWLAGGAVLAYLRARNSRWFGLMLYGLIGSALVAVIMFAFAGFLVLSTQQPQTTPETVERNIRTWLDTFRMTVQREVNPESHFVFLVTLPNGIRVSVRRTKELDRYITLQTASTISPEYQRIIAKFPTEQANQVTRELVLEIARLNIQWRIGPDPIKEIVLIKLVPITTVLDEAAFINHLYEIGNALILTNTKLQLALSVNPQLLF